MSYCVAWKKENRVYIIADSAISSTEDNINKPVSTFGEVQGLYGKFYVQEGILKIRRVNENIIVAFSGDIEIAEELLNHFQTVKEYLTYEQVEQFLKTNYYNRGIKLIVVQSGKFPRIFCFDGKNFDSVDYCEIGNGCEDQSLSNTMPRIIKDLYKPGIDHHRYLAMTLGWLQCYFIQKSFLKLGYGGTLYGVVVSNKIEWFRDMEYYFFEDDIKYGKTFSVIARENSVFSSSDIAGGTTAFLNYNLDISKWEDMYFRRSIIKSLDTKNAFYYIFFDRKNHVALFYEANTEAQNYFFKRWIRRDVKKTDYIYVLNPDLMSICEKYKQSDTDELALIELPCIKDGYMSNELAKIVCNPDDVLQTDIEKTMDFDFN